MQLLSFKALFSFFPHSSCEHAIPTTYSEILNEGAPSAVEARLENIRFDNSMRVLISLLTLIACAILRIGDFIRSVVPVMALFVSYSALQIFLMWFLKHTKRYLMLNLFLCAFDVTALSVGIYLTGAASSPLFFVYFMPLIIQAFHRDWNMLLSYGLGSMASYALVLFMTTDTWNMKVAAELFARFLFMGMTVGIALLAARLLSNKESAEARRSSKLRFMAYASDRLNAVNSEDELPLVLEQFSSLINLELKVPSEAWCRFFLSQQSKVTMTAIEDPNQRRPELKQELPMDVCPAARTSQDFSLQSAESGHACPVETFSFGSHLCVPIAGSQNEVYGVAFVGSPHEGGLGQEGVQLIHFVAKSLGLTIQRIKRFEELKMAAAMDTCAMATFVSSTRTMNETYAAILEGAKMILNADQVSLMLWNGHSGRLVTKAVIGDHARFEWDHELHMGESLAGRVLESNKPAWTYDLQSEAFFRDHQIPLRGVLCLPLTSLKNEPLGVMNVYVRDGGRMFSVEEIDLASTFATRAAIAVENAVLHDAERIKKKVFEENVFQQKAA